MVQQNCKEETTYSDNALLRREQTVWSEDSSGELHGESEAPQPTAPTDGAEARKDLWSEFIYRHHAEPRVQLHVPKAESCPIPLKKIDVTRSTHTNLDVMQEKRTDDYWNDDENRNVRFVDGVHKFCFVERETSNRICGPGED